MPDTDPPDTQRDHRQPIEQLIADIGDLRREQAEGFAAIVAQLEELNANTEITNRVVQSLNQRVALLEAAE